MRITKLAFIRRLKAMLSIIHH